jgi:hypothetical protein
MKRRTDRPDVSNDLRLFSVRSNVNNCKLLLLLLCSSISNVKIADQLISVWIMSRSGRRRCIHFCLDEDQSWRRAKYAERNRDVVSFSAQSILAASLFPSPPRRVPVPTPASRSAAATNQLAPRASGPPQALAGSVAGRQWWRDRTASSQGSQFRPLSRKSDRATSESAAVTGHPGQALAQGAWHASFAGHGQGPSGFGTRCPRYFSSRAA